MTGGGGGRGCGTTDIHFSRVWAGSGEFSRLLDFWSSLRPHEAEKDTERGRPETPHGEKTFGERGRDWGRGVPTSQDLTRSGRIAGTAEGREEAGTASLPRDRWAPPLRGWGTLASVLRGVTLGVKPLSWWHFTAAVGSSYDGVTIIVVCGYSAHVSTSPRNSTLWGN